MSTGGMVPKGWTVLDYPSLGVVRVHRPGRVDLVPAPVPPGGDGIPAYGGVAPDRGSASIATALAKQVDAVGRVVVRAPGGGYRPGATVGAFPVARRGWYGHRVCKHPPWGWAMIACRACQWRSVRMGLG